MWSEASCLSPMLGLFFEHSDASRLVLLLPRVLSREPQAKKLLKIRHSLVARLTSLVPKLTLLATRAKIAKMHPNIASLAHMFPPPPPFATVRKTDLVRFVPPS